ncbi:MAG: hypothetical protein IPL65_13360 [Lewinellaceae bacterium]|nr:hypothetical protein [Lewinellaceae bacterium]
MISFLALLVSAMPAQRPITIQTVLHDAVLVPGQSAVVKAGDTLVLETLRFYLGNLVCLHRGQAVWQDTAYHLYDLADQVSPQAFWLIPGSVQFDHLEFSLGVDSLTNVGAPWAAT